MVYRKWGLPVMRTRGVGVAGEPKSDFGHDVAVFAWSLLASALVGFVMCVITFAVCR